MVAVERWLVPPGVLDQAPPPSEHASVSRAQVDLPPPPQGVTEDLAGYVRPPTWSICTSGIVAGIMLCVMLFDCADLVLERRMKRVPEAPDSEQPDSSRRQRILLWCCLSLFAVDFYSSTPVNFFALEAGERGASQTLVSLYFSAFPAGGMVIAPITTCLLECVAANRINRLSLLLSGLTAALQGLGALLQDPPPGAFISYMVICRFVEGIPLIVTDVCAQTIVRRAAAACHIPLLLAIARGHVYTTSRCAALLRGPVSQVLRCFPMQELQGAFGALSSVRMLAALIGGPIGSASYAMVGLPGPCAPTRVDLRMRPIGQPHHGWGRSPAVARTRPQTCWAAFSFSSSTWSSCSPWRARRRLQARPQTGASFKCSVHRGGSMPCSSSPSSSMATSTLSARSPMLGSAHPHTT
jgi:hypothetical protein